MKAVRFFMGLAIVAVFIIVSPCSAQIMSFLRVLTSPRPAGIGQCAINLVDEESAVYNPGALGLFHLNKKFSFHYPLKSEYLPTQHWVNNHGPRMFGASVGHAFALSPGPKNWLLGLAFSYSRYRMISDFRDIEKNNYYDKSDNFSLAMGLDHWVRLGIGANYKMAKEYWPSEMEFGYNLKANAIDYGIIAEMPLSRFLSAFQGGNGQDISFECAPSIAYVDANNGGNPKFGGETSRYKLPHVRKLGLSIVGTLEKLNENIASLRISYEKESHLTSYYTDISKAGVEIGFLEIIFLRMGRANPQGTDAFSTVGGGLDLGVFLNKLYLQNHISSTRTWYNRAIRNLNIRIDYSHYNESGESPFSNSEFINIGLSF